MICAFSNDEQFQSLHQMTASRYIPATSLDKISVSLFMRVLAIALGLSVLPVYTPAHLQSTPASQSAPRPPQTATTTHAAQAKYHILYRTNAPFSAEQHTDELMAVHDGTVRQLPTAVILIYQDSAGRRRTDRHLFGMSSDDEFRRNIMIYEIDDPVAGFHFLIDPQNRVVHRSALEGQPPQANAELGAPFTGPRPPGVEAHTRVERLGPREILGVSVMGFRRTTTYGPDPNDPIPQYTAISESWTSRELWLPLLTKHSLGDGTNTTVAIVKLTLGEPDASLFHIPEDYAVVDEVAPFQMKFTESAKPGEGH